MGERGSLYWSKWYCGIGQQCISLGWVMKEKIIIVKKPIKSCLCTVDYEEEQNFRMDSPTHSRKSLWLACCIICNLFLDFKIAFLQGKAIES